MQTDDMPKRKRNNTVNNPKLYADIIDWVKRKEAAPEGEVVPMGDYTARCIIEVCTKLSFHYRFINYTWKDEMVCDGIENLILALPNYNIEYDNPHAYMSMVAFNAFVRRIKKEKRELAKKCKYFVTHVYDAGYTNEDNGDRDISEVSYNFYLDMVDKLEEYKEK
ncbi:RNA polymerase sigma factor [Paraglaciecola Antarctic GD virus 1]|nr:RNA polymerase sigma factor [Paraglaciecola Antarctic GD virus 1]